MGRITIGVSLDSTAEQPTSPSLFLTLALNLFDSGSVATPGILSMAVDLLGGSHLATEGILTAAANVLGSNNTAPAGSSPPGPAVSWRWPAGAGSPEGVSEPTTDRSARATGTEKKAATHPGKTVGDSKKNKNVDGKKQKESPVRRQNRPFARHVPAFTAPSPTLRFAKN